MENETTKTLEKKIRKFFRKKLRQNFWLGFKGDKYELADALPLNSYQDFEEELSYDELYELKEIFGEMEEEYEEKLLAVIPNNVWFAGCCSDLRLFDSFSGEQLAKLLNDGWNPISKLFFANGISLQQQFRIMFWLNKESLDNWISTLSSNDFSKFNKSIPGFFTYLSEKKGAGAEEIFKKLASLSDQSVAKLLENLEAEPKKRILFWINSKQRELLPIYQEVDKKVLFTVWREIDSWQNTDLKLYFWLYSELPQVDKDKFLVYLWDNKKDVSLWDAKLCAAMYRTIDFTDERVKFVEDLFFAKKAEEFENFYEELLLKEKEEMFNDLSKDIEGKKVIQTFLEAKKELGFFEKLVKEKYVTQ